MSKLFFASQAEFSKILTSNASKHERASAFATLCRINTLYMIMRAGSGHIGSSFSSMDIVTWIFTNELRQAPERGEFPYQDVYFSSKGHDVPALYSILIALGVIPFGSLHELRRLAGLPGHPDVATPGIAANTGSLGMGISKAKGMVAANRLQGKDQRVYVLTGDGELQEGQLWESLISAANREMEELFVIVDHNKIQSDIWVSKTSDLGDLESKFTSFGWHVQRADGHDFSSLENAFTASRQAKGKPHIIIADTVKGQGVSFMRHDVSTDDNALYRFHSGAPAVDVYEKAVQELIDRFEGQLTQMGLDAPHFETRDPIPKPQPASSPQKLIAAYAAALVDHGEKHDNLVVLDADLKLDCGLIPFQERFPERFIECGIAEQDMVSQAGGLALKGALPVVHSFACFLSTRPNEQIYVNSSEKEKIIYVGSLAGLLPAGPGHSHQSVRDISALGGIPGLTMIEPCCESEVDLALDYCLNDLSGSAYIRLVSIPCEVSFTLPEDYTLNYGQGTLLREGKDAVIFAYGPIMLEQAFQTSLKLEKNDIQAAVINLPWLNILDKEWLKKVIENIPFVFTIDNHYIKGGQGERISAALAVLDLEKPPAVRNFGLTDYPACGQNDEILEHHHLSQTELSRFIKKTIESSPRYSP